MKRYTVLGAGRQGTAAAYDLAKHGNADEITIVDTNSDALDSAIAFLSKTFSNLKLIGVNDVAAPGYLATRDAVVNALPYPLGLKISKMAIEAKVNVCDLGCDTDIVKDQLNLTKEAEAAGISIVPDCGLAPGSSTMAAMYVYDKMIERGIVPYSIIVYCGGLPTIDQSADLPLRYKIVFSPDGLLNNYLKPVWVLRSKDVVQIPAMESFETIKIGEDRLEAAPTAGGASLLPWKFQEKGLYLFEYKTLRYSGHWGQIKLLKDLDLLNEDPKTLELWKSRIIPRLEAPWVKDVVYLRAEAVGTKNDPYERATITLDLFEKASEGFSAMERTTGFAAGTVAAMLAEGKIKSGVNTPDEVISSTEYFAEMKKRGFWIAHKMKIKS